MTLGQVSLVISIAGAIPYMVQIIRGTVRPARTTWLVWACILGLALWSYRSSGASDSVWFLAGDFAVTAAIFLLSLWRGKGGWNRLDMACLGVAAMSLGLWQLTGSPFLGLWGVLLADAVALLPTLVKSLHDPESESATTFAFSSVAALLGFVAVGQWDLTLLFYPAYLFIANFVTAITVWVGKYQLHHLAKNTGLLRLSTTARKI